MGIKEQSGSTNLNSVPMPNNQMCVDVRISSVNGIQLKEQGSSGDEHAPKVRKPYTITKQRERWTEEEHKKFLEALILYGRAWRRIEEHLGTKTAVQIRSHAQKFFSKVVRESAANGTGSVKPIEIPPPRPKRKPVHPYPRKTGNSSSNGNLSLGKLERSKSPILSASEQENGSPTSVLSAVGTDTLGSLLSDLPNSCTSPVTSAAGSNERETSIKEENRPPSPGQTTAGLTTQDQSMMELDLGSEGHVPSKEASSVEAQVPCLRLFGRTVLVTDSHKPVTDSHKPSSSIVGNTVQFSKVILPTVGIESQDRCAYMDSGRAAQPLLQGAMHGDFLLGPGKSTWTPWSGGVLPMFYSLPSPYGDPMNPVEAGIIPQPWSALCGNLPIPFIHQQNISLGQGVSQPCVEASSDKEMQECSWSGSNTASATEGGHAVSSQSAEHCKHKDVARDGPALSSQRATGSKSVRGFVPYKRCVVEREVQHPQVVSDDGEGLTVELCL